MRDPESIFRIYKNKQVTPTTLIRSMGYVSTPASLILLDEIYNRCKNNEEDLDDLLTYISDHEIYST